MKVDKYRLLICAGVLLLSNSLGLFWQWNAINKLKMEVRTIRICESLRIEHGAGQGKPEGLSTYMRQDGSLTHLKR